MYHNAKLTFLSTPCHHFQHNNHQNPTKWTSRRHNCSLIPDKEERTTFISIQIGKTFLPLSSHSVQYGVTTAPYMNARRKESPPTPSILRRKNRRSPYEIARDRTRRTTYRDQARLPLIASWNGVILAESSEYEFIDGRFFFPHSSVNWKHLEENSARRYINPIGQGYFYDIVLRGPGENAKEITRNRCAVLSLQDVKRHWGVLLGFTYFWKGVKLSSKVS